MRPPRSYCPQSLILDVLGDRWTLLIIRDMILENKRYFREFLQSKEQIASNILSNRLRSLEEEGIITKASDPGHRQKIRYCLTEKGIDLFPIMMENARWSLKYKPVEPEDAEKAQNLLDGGSEKIEAIMKELRASHLHPNP